ncbi:MAG TPA: ice-binding family protein [Solirubrobacteraceae bacterium]
MVSAGLVFAGDAQAATAPVGLGSAKPFSVLAGSTVTNTGPTTLFGDLGLDPGTSITGAPHALGSTHINDGVALSAKNSLVVSYDDAAGRPATTLASKELGGKTFTPGVYNAASSLLLSAGTVTLNAEGNPNAVFIFQIGSTLTTGSGTKVNLINGAQPCNVFWKIGSSATRGTNSTFAGTVMALTTITAKTGTTLDGRLLARNSESRHQHDHHVLLRRGNHRFGNYHNRRHTQHRRDSGHDDHRDERDTGRLQEHDRHQAASCREGQGPRQGQSTRQGQGPRQATPDHGA